MKEETLFLLFLFVSYFAFSQNIDGYVLSQTDESPLVGVNVYLKESNIGSATNSKGEFNLKIDYKLTNKDSLIISHIGYLTKKIAVSDFKNSNKIIYLISQTQSLEDVLVSSREYKRNSLRFEKLTSLDKGIYSFGSTLVDGKIYLFGGDRSNETNEYMQTLSSRKYENIQYDAALEALDDVGFDYSYRKFSRQSSIYYIENDSWSYSNLEFREKANCEIHYYEDKIYVIGGRRLSKNKSREYLDDKIEVYDLVKDSVFLDDVNPHQAVNFASVLKNENLIIIGGSVKVSKNKVKIFSNKVHLYNLKTGLWFELDDMPTAKETKGILVKDKIYLIGGNSGNDISLIESLDLNSGKWKIEGKSFEVINRPAITHFNDTIYIYENGKVLTFNINTNELNQYLIGLFLKKANMHFYNNKLYILGGYLQNEYSITPSKNVYSIDLDELEKTKINKSKILK